MALTCEPLVIPDVWRISPAIYHDPRGFFLETYQARKYSDVGLSVTFVQDNHSHSRRGALRGLHYQLHRPQAKLVYAVTERSTMWPSISDEDRPRSAGGLGRCFPTRIAASSSFLKVLPTASACSATRRMSSTSALISTTRVTSTESSGLTLPSALPGRCVTRFCRRKTGAFRAWATLRRRCFRGIMDPNVTPLDA